jgi:hypothetical protein
MCCWLCTAVPAESLHLQKQRSTQSTAHSHSTIKCNLSVTITKSSPWRWPSRVETCRSVLRLIIKLSLCICWWLVLLYLLFSLQCQFEWIFFRALLLFALLWYTPFDTHTSAISNGGVITHVWHRSLLISLIGCGMYRLSTTIVIWHYVN